MESIAENTVNCCKSETGGSGCCGSPQQLPDIKSSPTKMTMESLLEGLGTELCPADTIMAGRASQCDGCPGQSACQDFGTEDPDKELVDLRMNAIKHRILVISGKGGVGKSSIAAFLSMAMGHAKKKSWDR